MTAPTSSSLPTKEQDWADISDDEQEEPVPTVKVDTLDLTSLSLNEKDKQATPGDSSLNSMAEYVAPQASAKSLADRISTGEMTSEKKTVEEVDKASATSQSEEKKKEKEVKEKEVKEPDTNLIQNKYEVAVKLQDLQADPNSPLYSVKSFDDLGL